MLRLLVITIALVFILPSKIGAQLRNYTFQHLTTKEGLVSDLSNNESGPVSKSGLAKTSVWAIIVNEK